MTIGRIPSVEGGIQPTIVDAKGDLLAGTAADTIARLPLGSNGQVLKVNTATATGLEWSADSTGMTNPMTTTGDTIYSSSGSTPARLGIGSTGQVLTVSGGLPVWSTISSGGMTSIASGSLSSTALSLSSISGAYKDLVLVMRGFSTSTDSKINVTINGITSGYAVSERVNNNSGGTDSAASISINHLLNYLAANTSNTIIIQIPDYANTSSIKTINYYTAFFNTTARAGMGTGCVNSTAAITSITATVQSGGTYDAGTYTLYGVN